MKNERSQAVIHQIDGVPHLAVPIARIGYVSAKFQMFFEGSVNVSFRIDPVSWLDIMECNDLKNQIERFQKKKAEDGS